MECQTYKINYHGIDFIRKVRTYERSAFMGPGGYVSACEVKAYVDFYIEDMYIGSVVVCLPQSEVGPRLSFVETEFLNMAALEDTW